MQPKPVQDRHLEGTRRSTLTASARFADRLADLSDPALGRSSTSAALTGSYNRLNLGPLCAVKIFLIANLDDVEVLEEIVVVHSLLILARFVYEPDAVRTIAATVVADLIDCT